MMQKISNGILISPVHRVVTNSDRERISLAVFCFLDPKREIGPVAGLSTSDLPQMYRTVKDYESIFFEHYQLGQRPLNDVKLENHTQHFLYCHSSVFNENFQYFSLARNEQIEWKLYGTGF